MDGSRGNISASLSCRVLIVGCGLSGLATAIAMRLSGHRIAVFERMPALREIGAGIQLSPNATRLFKKWNISEKITEYAYQPEEGYLRSYRGPVLSKQASGVAIEEKYKAPYLVIHRADLLNVLASEAEKLGVEIKLGSNIISIDFLKPSIILSTGERYEGDVVFGADGERSTCRDALLGQPDLPQSTGDTVYRIAVKGCDVSQRDGFSQLIHHSSVNVWMGPDAHAVSYMLRKTDVLNVVLVCPEKSDNKIPYGPQKADVAELQKAFSDWDPVFGALLDIPKLDCTKWTLLHINEVTNWCHTSGKFALIGDAAHAILPYLAQGAAQAFEDAGVLGTLFAMIKDISQIPDALHIYEQIRKPRTKEVRLQTNTQKLVYGLRDGPLQQNRDKELASVAVAGCPNALDDPTFQKWLWGYDAVYETKQAWNTFVQEKEREREREREMAGPFDA